MCTHVSSFISRLRHKMSESIAVPENPMVSMISSVAPQVFLFNKLFINILCIKIENPHQEQITLINDQI